MYTGDLICNAQTHLEAVVRPTSELHVTVLVVEGKPGDVNLAGGLEDAGRDVGTLTLAGHHHIGGVRPVKRFISAGVCGHF